MVVVVVVVICGDFVRWRKEENLAVKDMPKIWRERA